MFLMQLSFYVEGESGDVKPDVKQEAKEEEPVQAEAEPETKSPRRRNAVRNGAGPKSKTRGRK